MQLMAIEGNTQKLDGGAMFGNAPRAVWAEWCKPDEKNRITLACRALLCRTDDGRNLLFETGIGSFFEPKLRERYGVVESRHILLENLSKHGIAQEDIDAVILSHLHFDHAGGLLSAFEEGEPRLLFPNAKYYVSETHWQRALHPHPRDKASFVPVLNELLEKSGRLVLVPHDGKSDLSPLVTFRFSNGHTVGLMLAQIHLAGGPLVFCSDLIPGIPWVHVPLSMGYDRFPELLTDEKKDLLEELRQQHGYLFFTHDAVSACGRLERDAKGKFFATPVGLEEII